MKKSTILWILAVIITLLAVIYQKKTGPTYPKKVKTELNGKDLSFNLIRTGVTGRDASLKLEIAEESISGKVMYRRFPTNEEWQEKEFIREGENLIAMLPSQPPAGKIEYYVVLSDGIKTVTVAKEKPIKIRFRGDVPAYILIPHILLMFTAMLISTVAGFFAFYKLPKFRLYGSIAFLTLLLGGMIFGPIVQDFAFGELWTGIPFGWDLTDNKTLISVIFWAIAFFANWKKERPVWIVVAAIVLLVIYSIPHSMFGSELDFTSGDVISA